MKILFHLGHPAHFHLFSPVIHVLVKKGHDIQVVIKKKDVLEYLLKKTGISYENLLPRGRKNSRAAMVWGMVQTDLKLYRYAKKNLPDIMAGTSVAISHVGKFLGIPSINVNEDDAEAVPWYARLAYPWADTILAPDGCRTGKWQVKTVYYSGYHELAYLHPGFFQPKKNRITEKMDVSKPFYLLRLSGLSAHHDTGKSGITDDLARKIIDLIKPQGNVYITSERPLMPEFEPYRIAVDPLDIHHALAFASLYIGDSQTMTAEAAVLGTPALRFNDFVGKLGYLEELEHKYGLTFGFKTDEPGKLLAKIEELLNTPNLKDEWRKRRDKMLADKIDVTSFLVWFIEEYPKSVEIMKNNPEYQYKFK